MEEVKKLHQKYATLFEENSELSPENHITIEIYTLTHFIRFLMEEGYESAGYKLKSGSPAPDVKLIKCFIRWYIHSSTGYRKAQQEEDANNEVYSGVRQKTFRWLRGSSRHRNRGSRPVFELSVELTRRAWI